MKEKQKPMFDLPRQVHFRKLFDENLERISLSVFKKGPKSHTGSWCGKGIRKRVRELARQEARASLRRYRTVQTV
jgi:hypothetical protein